MSRQINLAVDDDLWPKIEEERGLATRTRWINDVLRKHLDSRPLSNAFSGGYGSQPKIAAPTHTEE